MAAGSAPASSSAGIRWNCFSSAAWMSGVTCPSACASRLDRAPFSSSQRAASRWPNLQAKCSGVKPAHEMGAGRAVDVGASRRVPPVVHLCSRAGDAHSGSASAAMTWQQSTLVSKLQA